MNKLEMSDLQAAKAHVLAFYDALDAARPDESAQALEQYCAAGFSWRGMHPFPELSGAGDVAAQFWTPLKTALTPIQRRPDIFLAGQDFEGKKTSIWVAQMGHLLGNLDGDWLGIPASRKMTFLRYADFHRIEHGLIAQTVSFCDILSVIQQAGLRPLPASTGLEMITPGPRTQDGNLYSSQPLEESMKTRDLLGDLQGSKDPLPHAWHSDMCWFGPAGIGASAGRDGYRRDHLVPFEQGVQTIFDAGPESCIAEGGFACSFGFPSRTLRATGGFLGLTASSTEADMRVAEFYRRDGDKLAEAWVFMDILHFLNQQGVDILARLKHA